MSKKDKNYSLYEVYAELHDMLSKLPSSDRELILRDLKQFPKGIPEEVTYKPSTWCSKKPVVLTSGNIGLQEYLEYVSDSKGCIAAVFVKTGLATAAIIFLAQISLSIMNGNAEGVIQATRSSGDFIVKISKQEFMRGLVGLAKASKWDWIYAISMSGFVGLYVATLSQITDANYRQIEGNSEFLSLKGYYVQMAVKLLSEVEGVNPNSILTDTEIKTLLKKAPTTINELGRIKGFGLNTLRMEKYGQAIVDLLNTSDEDVKTLMGQTDQDEVNELHNSAPKNLMYVGVGSGISKDALNLSENTVTK